MDKLICTIAILFTLAGCSSVPPYQELGFGGGYKNEEISPGVWELYYGGNGFATIEGVREAWHRRAADLCDDPNYEYEITFDGEKYYESYASGTYVPIGMNFPEVIGVVRCNGAEDS